MLSQSPFEDARRFTWLSSYELLIFFKIMATDPSPDTNAPPKEEGKAPRHHLLAIFFDVIRSRLELFLTEAEEQKWRLMEIFIWLLVMAVVSLLLLMVLVALSVLVLPSEWRIVGLCFWVIMGFGSIGLGVHRVKNYAQQSGPMFAETMNQLKKDQACFSDHT